LNSINQNEPRENFDLYTYYLDEEDILVKTLIMIYSQVIVLEKKIDIYTNTDEFFSNAFFSNEYTKNAINNLLYWDTLKELKKSIPNQKFKNIELAYEQDINKNLIVSKNIQANIDLLHNYYADIASNIDNYYFEYDIKNDFNIYEFKNIFAILVDNSLLEIYNWNIQDWINKLLNLYKIMNVVVYWKYPYIDSDGKEHIIFSNFLEMYVNIWSYMSIIINNFEHKNSFGLTIDQLINIISIIENHSIVYWKFSEVIKIRWVIDYPKIHIPFIYSINSIQFIKNSIILWGINDNDENNKLKEFIVLNNEKIELYLKLSMSIFLLENILNSDEIFWFHSDEIFYNNRIFKNEKFWFHSNEIFYINKIYNSLHKSFEYKIY